MKPTVRRARTSTGALANGWILTRPPYGFGTTEITRHATWRAAHTALRNPIGSAGASAERNTGGYVPGLTHGWFQSSRPRWIEMGDR